MLKRSRYSRGGGGSGSGSDGDGDGDGESSKIPAGECKGGARSVGSDDLKDGQKGLSGVKSGNDDGEGEASARVDGGLSTRGKSCDSQSFKPVSFKGAQDSKSLSMTADHGGRALGRGGGFGGVQGSKSLSMTADHGVGKGRALGRGGGFGGVHRSRDENLSRGYRHSGRELDKDDGRPVTLPTSLAQPAGDRFQSARKDRLVSPHHKACVSSPHRDEPVGGSCRTQCPRDGFVRRGTPRIDHKGKHHDDPGLTEKSRPTHHTSHTGSPHHQVLASIPSKKHLEKPVGGRVSQGHNTIQIRSPHCTGSASIPSKEHHEKPAGGHVSQGRDTIRIRSPHRTGRVSIPSKEHHEKPAGGRVSQGQNTSQYTRNDADRGHRIIQIGSPHRTGPTSTISKEHHEKQVGGRGSQYVRSEGHSGTGPVWTTYEEQQGKPARGCVHQYARNGSHHGHNTLHIGSPHNIGPALTSYKKHHEEQGGRRVSQYATDDSHRDHTTLHTGSPHNTVPASASYKKHHQEQGGRRVSQYATDDSHRGHTSIRIRSPHRTGAASITSKEHHEEQGRRYLSKYVKNEGHRGHNTVHPHHPAPASTTIKEHKQKQAGGHVSQHARNDGCQRYQPLHITSPLHKGSASMISKKHSEEHPGGRSHGSRGGMGGQTATTYDSGGTICGRGHQSVKDGIQIDASESHVPEGVYVSVEEPTCGDARESHGNDPDSGHVVEAPPYLDEDDQNRKWIRFQCLCNVYASQLQDDTCTAMNLHDDYIVPSNSYPMKLCSTGPFIPFHAKSHEEVLNAHFADSTRILPCASTVEENKRIVLAAVACRQPYQIFVPK